MTSLITRYENKGYCFYFDGFFSKIPMIQDMLEKNNFACGTIKSNRRHFPLAVLKDDKKLKKGQYDIVNSNEISISKWKDRGQKCVNVISNMHDSSCSLTRRDNRGLKEVIKVPISIVDYNNYMGGVDHFDQFHSYYNVAWKSRRWWLKLFYYLFDASIVNSFVIYQSTCNLHDPKSSNYIHLLFRSILANQLIEDFSSKKQPGIQKNLHKMPKKKSGKLVVGNQYYLQNVGDHMPIKGTYRRCGYCSDKKNQKRSNIICKKCDIALCLECFEPFHNT